MTETTESAQPEYNPLQKMLDNTTELISLCTRCKVLPEISTLPGITYTATTCENCQPAEELNLRFFRKLRIALDDL